MQVRAGTGGDEAGLWAADLLRMYQRYADSQRWKTYIISENPAEAGGFKEVVVQVNSSPKPTLPCRSDVKQLWPEIGAILSLPCSG